MKKFSIIALCAMLVFTLTACGGSDDKDKGSDDKSCKVKIGFVTDMGGIDDRSFNQGSWEGIKKFAEDEGLGDDCITYLESKAEADYVSNLTQLSEDGFDLVVAAGYLFEDAMKDVSAQFPETNFLIIDSVVEADNVQSAVFAAHEGSYLAGVAAALEAKALGSDSVGFIGGMEGPVIGAFQAGFEQGALAANPKAKIYVDYAGSFDDAGKAKTLAAKQYDAGVKVIYAAAGNAGNGVIQEAQERTEKGEELYTVGVDRDQYEDGKMASGDSVILTSALKRVDVATYDACKQILDGNFKAETITYNFDLDGVGFPEENPNLSEDITKALNDAIAGIKDGSIKVSEEAKITNGGTN
ncbi:nucleoside-binding protein [Breznakia blatticola]|uniref:Nucleoside-binding protein n=1 Tax=Breznakia blatticola TaxID=1754012 RepID=A0A4V3G982_9FIRM|nr:BMP family ABC transporter substrate-binding protein [Breznakia blatticola]TDW25771.1 nucleoside-binding protein [Breznakia blatticola]